jgi:hypothetical protein
MRDVERVGNLAHRLALGVACAQGFRNSWKHSIREQGDVYFEGGNHTTVVHVSTAASRRGEKTAASVSGETMPVVARDSLHLAEPGGARLALQDRERFGQVVIDNMIANAVELLGGCIPQRR